MNSDNSMDKEQKVNVRDTGRLLFAGLLINAVANATEAFGILLDPVVTNPTVRVLVVIAITVWLVWMWKSIERWA